VAYRRAVVDRYVFVKLLEPDVPSREEIAVHLGAELARIAGGGKVTVGIPADASAARWDLSIVIRAAGLEEWDRIALAAGPVLEDWLPARAAVVKAWTFELRHGI